MFSGVVGGVVEGCEGGGRGWWEDVRGMVGLGRGGVGDGM